MMMMMMMVHIYVRVYKLAFHNSNHFIAFEDRK